MSMNGMNNPKRHSVLGLTKALGQDKELEGIRSNWMPCKLSSGQKRTTSLTPVLIPILSRMYRCDRKPDQSDYFLDRQIWKKGCKIPLKMAKKHYKF